MKSDLEEFEATLRDELSGLRARIVRDNGNFTLALFGVFALEDGDRPQLGGTGMLVAVGDSHYILTAARKWDEAFRSARKVFRLHKKATGDQVNAENGHWGYDSPN